MTVGREGSYDLLSRVYLFWVKREGLYDLLSRVYLFGVG